MYHDGVAGTLSFTRVKCKHRTSLSWRSLDYCQGCWHKLHTNRLVVHNKPTSRMSGNTGCRYVWVLVVKKRIETYVWVLVVKKLIETLWDSQMIAVFWEFADKYHLSTIGNIYYYSEFIRIPISLFSFSVCKPLCV